MPTCAEESIAQLWKAERPPRAASPKSPLGSRGATSPPVKPVPVEPQPIQIGSLVRNLCAAVGQLLWSQLLIGPTLWVSICLWASWKIASIPLGVIKWLLTLCQTSPIERFRKKRTVLISGGSSVQALHLARNFYSAGARVVMCEVEGNFDLTRFSTAVHRYYTLPKPDDLHVQDYIHTLCEIVAREGVAYYIPVSSTTEAIYDALAKPHLELLNCVVFCPNTKEVRLLDDLLQVLEKCRHSGLPTPLYYHVTSIEDVYRLYDTGLLRTTRHFLATVGTSGVRDRVKVALPPFRQDFRPPGEVSAARPWIVVQDMKGEHFVTCTTIKYGAVVANISCRQSAGALIPVESAEITRWIQQFVHRLKLLQLSGHFTFELVVSGHGGVVPLGCRVGVPLPYICHTSVHPRLVWKPCRHFSRSSSGPLDAPRYWMGDVVLSALRSPSVESVNRLVGTVLDQREALFACWDPLPYAAYYHLYLPGRIILQFLRGGTRDGCVTQR